MENRLSLYFCEYRNKNRSPIELKYIDDMVEYAESCVILSALALEEAKLAKLEAIEVQDEYDEKYGEE